MLLTYVRRELRGRRRQTVIVAAGLALAVALVLAVTAASAGVRDAQSDVLASVYGVGTDITVTQAGQPGQGGNQRFQFGAGDGASSDGNTTVSRDDLTVNPGAAAMSDTALTKVQGVGGVADASATLVLRSVSFSGQLPDPATTGQQPGAGGAGGGGGGYGNRFGGGNFDVHSFTVEGVKPGTTALGPLAGAQVTNGRALTTADADQSVALVSKTYADTEKLAVGGSLTIKGTTVKIVGILDSSSSASTLSDVYLPLGVAQKLADLSGKVTNLYVQATSSDAVSTTASGIRAALPDTTVSTQSDLADGVTGSLSSASSLVKNLGTWLSVAVLVAAFVLAVLFTISGVTRRTRDFGTLKAIGWSNSRIVRQVGTESLVQGAIGGVAGLVVGLLGIVAINASGITLSGDTRSSTASTVASAAQRQGGGAGGGGAFGGGQGNRFANAASNSVDVVLHAPISVTVIVLGIALALLGGLLAGVVGGWRASRLRPAAALRSLD
jgi:ABC-type antimicrobial peptide transport system permease subunit